MGQWKCSTSNCEDVCTTLQTCKESLTCTLKWNSCMAYEFYLPNIVKIKSKFKKLTKDPIQRVIKQVTEQKIYIHQI